MSSGGSVSDTGASFNVQMGSLLNSLLEAAWWKNCSSPCQVPSDFSPRVCSPFAFPVNRKYGIGELWMGVSSHLHRWRLSLASCPVLPPFMQPVPCVAASFHAWAVWLVTRAFSLASSWLVGQKNGNCYVFATAYTSNLVLHFCLHCSSSLFVALIAHKHTCIWKLA